MQYLYEGGLTVKQLKALIKDWADQDENGKPNEVWVETGRGLSSPVTEVSPLNGRMWKADVLFESGAFEGSDDGIYHLDRHG